MVFFGYLSLGFDNVRGLRSTSVRVGPRTTLRSKTCTIDLQFQNKILLSHEKRRKISMNGWLGTWRLPTARATVRARRRGPTPDAKAPPLPLVGVSASP